MKVFNMPDAIEIGIARHAKRHLPDTNCPCVEVFIMEAVRDLIMIEMNNTGTQPANVKHIVLKIAAKLERALAV